MCKMAQQFELEIISYVCGGTTKCVCDCHLLSILMDDIIGHQTLTPGPAPVYHSRYTLVHANSWDTVVLWYIVEKHSETHGGHHWPPDAHSRARSGLPFRIHAQHSRYTLVHANTLLCFGILLRSIQRRVDACVLAHRR